MQSLEEAVQASGSKSVRFVMTDGRTVVGRIIKIESDALLIRRPSAGLLTLPLTDIAGVKIKSADGAFLLGRVAQMNDGGIGWIAEQETAVKPEVAGARIGVPTDTGGPLVRLDADAAPEPAGREALDSETDMAALVPESDETPGENPFVDEAIRLEVTTSGASEIDELISFELTLSEPAPQPILIIYTMIDDTAKAPGDYSHGQGVVIFEPGETEATVTTSIIDDTAVEGPEDFQFFVTGDPASVTIEQRKIAATIEDDDG